MPPTNLLLIHSDQHRYDCLGAHGLRNFLHTPNLDRLATEGTLFRNAFCTAPICTPARASLLTGAWPSTHGSFSIPSAELNRPARQELPVLTRLLADHGYRVTWTGKYHGELASPPSPEWGVEEFVESWKNYESFRAQEGVPPLQRAHGLFGEVDVNCPPEKSCLAWQADHVIRQLSERREAPFFIRWDPPEPHLPCNPTLPFANLFADARIPPWDSFPDALEGKPAAQRRQQKIWGVENWSWEEWLPVVRNYLAIIAELDFHIGRVLDHLDRLNLADNTLVIYSTDHGDFCGGHSMMDKHFCMYEDIVRIPLLLRHPGLVPAGTTCDAFASGSIDIARTLLAAAGVPASTSFVGEDLVALATGTSAALRPYAFAQYYGTESGSYSCRMIRDTRFKFVYHPVGDCHEFYDLAADPGEQCNRIDDPALCGEIARLKAALWDTMKECHDPLANGWTAVELKNRRPLATESAMPLC